MGRSFPLAQLLEGFFDVGHIRIRKERVGRLGDFKWNSLFAQYGFDKEVDALSFGSTRAVSVASAM